MKLKNISKDDLCKAIGISKTAFYRKCRGVSDFTREEILDIAKLLDLSGQDILDIFFTLKVS